MKKISFLLFLFLYNGCLFGQPNCETMKKDSLCYNACLEVYKADIHGQGSYASQKHFDVAIKNCPTLAYAYFEKSVAYLKRGYFPQWKKLIDKAIELKPKEYLFYRAWCQFTFLHNYEATIIDLNKLSKLYSTPFFGVGQNGDYDLRVVLALSYKMIGEKEKAIEMLEKTFSEKGFFLGIYDYLHLGVLYLETNQLDKAINAFEKQLIENELAEVRFYLGKVYYFQGNSIKGKEELNKALLLYKKGRSMRSNYYEYIDQIYEEEIMKCIKDIQ